MSQEASNTEKARWFENGLVFLPFPHYADEEVDGTYDRILFERKAFKDEWMRNAPFSGDWLAKSTLAAMSASAGMIGLLTGNFADHSSIEKQADKVIPVVRIDADISQPKLLTGIFGAAGMLAPIAGAAVCATLRARRYSIAASSQFAWEHDPY